MKGYALRVLAALVLAGCLLCPAALGAGDIELPEIPTGGGPYAVTVAAPEGGGGTAVAGVSMARAGDRVTVTALPDEGWAAESLTVADALGGHPAVTDNGDGTFAFTMPSASVRITPVFTRLTAGTLTDGTNSVRWTRLAGGSVAVEGDLSPSEPVVVAVYDDAGRMTALTWLTEAGQTEVAAGHIARIFWLSDPTGGVPKTEPALILPPA